MESFFQPGLHLCLFARNISVLYSRHIWQAKSVNAIEWIDSHLPTILYTLLYQTPLISFI